MNCNVCGNSATKINGVGWYCNRSNKYVNECDANNE